MHGVTKHLNSLIQKIIIPGSGQICDHNITGLKKSRSLRERKFPSLSYSKDQNPLFIVIPGSQDFQARSISKATKFQSSRNSRDQRTIPGVEMPGPENSQSLKSSKMFPRSEVLAQKISTSVGEVFVFDLLP